ncbi:MAG: hypothetical protein IT198_14120 [Acidimicrobiia bacterium]|nr:hypothetical protein [Acidimicrobiia bacterium]
MTARIVPQLALWLTNAGYAHDLQEAVAQSGEANICVVAVDWRQLMRVPFHALVVPTDESALDARFVASLHARGAHVYAVHDPEGPDATRDLERAQAALVDAVFELPLDGEELLRRIVYTFETSDFDPSVEDFLAADPGPAPAGTQPHGPRGTITAVLGPSASQRTEVALMLAAGAAWRGEAVVVAEAGETGTGLAYRLRLDAVPNMAGAVDAFRRCQPVRAQPVQVDAVAFDAVPGFPATTSWPQVHPGDVWSTLEELASRYDHVIVLGGYLLEHLRFDATAERFGVTRALVTHADGVVAVAHPNGLDEFHHWIADLHDLIDTSTAVDVVVNNVLDRFLAAEAANCLVANVRFAQSISVIPHRPAIAYAAWEGKIEAGRRHRRMCVRLAGVILPLHASTKRPLASRSGDGTAGLPRPGTPSGRGRFVLWGRRRNGSHDAPAHTEPRSTPSASGRRQ